MAEIEVEREMLVEKMLFTEGFNANAIQKDADYYSLVPSVGEKTYCMEAQLDCCPFSCDVKLLDDKLRPIQKQLQHLLRKADEFQNRLIYSIENGETEGYTRVVPTFLKICAPYFNYLESTARNTSPGRSALPLYIRSQLLQLSQQLCRQLEQLVLAYASYSYVSLAETDPMGVSHFYIGHCQVDNIKMSIFRYCQSTPFLALTDDGLYKRMRWNVVHDNRVELNQVTEGEPEAESEKRMEGNRTEYFFLCHEDVHAVNSDPVHTDRTGEEAVKWMWSVGKWVQTFPDPDTEDINDWLSCTIPQGHYKPLVYLGNKEPSSCFATDCLLGVLLSQADESVTHFNKKSMLANQE